VRVLLHLIYLHLLLLLLLAVAEGFVRMVKLPEDLVRFPLS